MYLQKTFSSLPDLWPVVRNIFQFLGSQPYKLIAYFYLRMDPVRPFCLGENAFQEFLHKLCKHEVAFSIVKPRLNNLEPGMELV